MFGLVYRSPFPATTRKSLYIFRTWTLRPDGTRTGIYEHPKGPRVLP